MSVTVETYRAILRRAEWQGPKKWNDYAYKYMGSCPVCEGTRPVHEPDCVLHRALIDGACDYCEGEPVSGTIANGKNYTQDVELVCPQCGGLAA